VAYRQLIVPEGKSPRDAMRREEAEAPHGRCGDKSEEGGFPGCGVPLVDDGWYVCPDYPDCCRP
jgi:hypothetical protein